MHTQTLKPPRVVAPGGPVSRALAVMAGAVTPAGIFAGLDPEQRNRLRAFRHGLRERVAADLALLDALDGDADFEPSLANAINASQEHWGMGSLDDREGDDDREADVDAEPSLCGITVDPRFATGAAGGHDGDDEPSLASLGGTAEGGEGSQAGPHWHGGDRREREEDTGSRTHEGDSLFLDPGEALTATRHELHRRAVAASRPQGSAGNVLAFICGGRA